MLCPGASLNMAQRLNRRAFVAGSVTAAVALPAAGIIGAVQTPRLPARERRTLRAAIDAIIPAGGRMPAASAVGGVAYVERMCAQDAVFRQLLLAGLRTLEPLAAATPG